MVDETLSGGGSTASICPWCSARYTGDPDTCPSCGAALAVDPAADPSLPGLTAIDTAAIVRAKTPISRPRNRFLSWISGEYPDQTGTTAQAGALAPPDPDVRREILRLELEAEVANLQAEAGALLAEATMEGRAPDASAEDAAAARTVADELSALTTELSETDRALDAPTALDAEIDPAAATTADPAPTGRTDEDTRPG